MAAIPPDANVLTMNLHRQLRSPAAVKPGTAYALEAFARYGPAGQTIAFESETWISSPVCMSMR